MLWVLASKLPFEGVFFFTFVQYLSVDKPLLVVQVLPSVCAVE